LASSGVIDVGVNAAQSVGRYFSILSFFPAVIYAAYTYILVAAQSWSRPPDWSRAIHSLEHLGVGGVAFLLIAGFGLGLAIHPLQFAVVQFFEGYWGVNPSFLNLRAERIIRYQRQYEKIDDMATLSSDYIDDLDELAKGTVGQPAMKITPAHRVTSENRVDEANRFLDSNAPHADRFVMPTRLGNVLRKFELNAGNPYALDSIAVVPRVLLIAPDAHVNYVNDQRSQLDLAVRMVFMSLIATATTVFFLWPYPLWALIAIIPYSIAYISYRGSIVAARGYGSALKILIDLNRFALYEQLHVSLPNSNSEERWNNRQVTRLLKGQPAVITYQHFRGDTGGSSS
jgi:hypothetical protein